jgi:acyl-CoA synthetase (AMP-forming)/AMP-acid ligase II
MGGLGELLTEHPFPDASSLISTLDRTVTAGAARQGAATVAAQLQAMGLEPGQAVVVQLPNGPDFILAMFGVWLAGGVFIPATLCQVPAPLW